MVSLLAAFPEVHLDARRHRRLPWPASVFAA
jgi:hypothetical protein